MGFTAKPQVPQVRGGEVMAKPKWVQKHYEADVWWEADLYLGETLFHVMADERGYTIEDGGGATVKTVTTKRPGPVAVHMKAAVLALAAAMAEMALDLGKLTKIPKELL